MFMQPWPELSVPWVLKELILFGPECKGDMFKGKQLHLMFPQLERFSVFLGPEDRMTVPDKAKFQNLQNMDLQGGGLFRTEGTSKWNYL